MTSFVVSSAKKFAAGEEGATLVEYGALIGLIAAVAVGIVLSLGIKIGFAWNTVNEAMKENTLT